MYIKVPRVLAVLIWRFKVITVHYMLRRIAGDFKGLSRI